MNGTLKFKRYSCENPWIRQN